MKPPHNDDQFRSYPINPANNNESNPKILNVLYNLIHNSIRKHSKVIVTHLVINYPSIKPEGHEYPDQAFEVFINTLIHFLKRNGFDPVYVAVTEKDSSPHPHYHLCLACDGRFLWSFDKQLLKAKEYWCNALKIEYNPGLIYHCSATGINYKRKRDIFLERNNPNIECRMQDTFTYISYLAKLRTKFKIGDHGNSWSSSLSLKR
ncbi:inovirus-type Gp2 protein [Lentisphaera marina]|uniref:YagK/YfjJ domain-containing protein n=1 Tax=Lentisphaera marina TaxID=1111041 RepID=UPI002365B91E|nr:inovirus-type Gp2 protein [Lentisphaera marina]MDD7984342.1 inovirus-type Gp2 protein [Lentisphaera marina]